LPVPRVSDLLIPGFKGTSKISKRALSKDPEREIANVDNAGLDRCPA